MYLPGAERRRFDCKVTERRHQLAVDAEVAQETGRSLARAGRDASSPVDEDVGPALRQHARELLRPEGVDVLAGAGRERRGVLARHDEVAGHEVEGEAVDAAGHLGQLDQPVVDGVVARVSLWHAWSMSRVGASR